MNSSTVPISDYPAAEDLLCASPLSPSPASPDTTPQPGEAGEAMAPPAPVPWSHRAGSALPTDDSPSAAANLGSYLSRHKLGLQMNQCNRVAKPYTPPVGYVELMFVISVLSFFCLPNAAVPLSSCWMFWSSSTVRCLFMVY